MNILRRTPRTDLQEDALIDRMAEFYKRLAEELGVPTLSLDKALTRFARLAARVEFEKGEVDFEQPAPLDSEETIIKKFMAYLGSDCVETIDLAHSKIAEADRPAISISAPTAPANVSADFLADEGAGKTTS